MQKSKLYSIVFILLAGLAFAGFQCSSTDLTSAKLYIHQKNYDKALEALQREVEKNPQSAQGYFLMGNVYHEKEEYDKMIEAYDKSLSISNEFKSQIDDNKLQFWVNLFTKGVNYYQKGVNTTNEDSSKIFFDKSINMFEYASKLEPDSADTYKNLAVIYLAAGENEKAIEPLQKLIKLEQSLDGYKYLGEIYYNQGINLKNQFASSKNAEDSVKALDSFNKAIEVLQEGRNNFPDNPEILLTLSNSYINANKTDVALSTFKELVEKDPENQYYRYNYGVLLLGKNDYETAADQFKKAVDLDPEYQDAIYNLAVTYVKWGTTISKKAEDSGETDNTEYKEKYQLALPYLEKLVELKPEDAATWELLGKVYTLLDMNDDAQNAFNKADELRK